MKLIKIIRHTLRVEYRLTVITAKETTNTYGTNRRLLSKASDGIVLLEPVQERPVRAARKTYRLR